MGMNILHLTGDREDTGGVLSVIRNLQEASRPWGWRHTVWVHHSFQQKRLPTLDLRFSRWSCSESSKHGYLFWCAFRSWPELKRLLATESFDIVHAHTRCTALLAWMIAQSLGRRVIFTNHNYARRTGLYQKIARKPGVYTVLLTPNMARHYGIAPEPPRVNVISACCADRQFEEPLVARAISTPPPKTVRFAGVGTIQPFKKWHLLVDALLALPEADRQRIEISIWGPVLNQPEAVTYDRELRQAVEQHRLAGNIRFRGPTNAVNDRLRECDWFILPTTKEPCSVALCEALALGIPALVSASGGNIDIVAAGKTGVFFESENPHDLAARLKDILSGKVAPAPPEIIRESVRARSATQVAGLYGELYQQVLRF
jgi:L-malate glycosyltransferase